MPLFVQFTQGTDPDGAVAAVRQAIRSALSPRYVPDEIYAVSAIPHTRTGKKLEVPVKRLLMGQPLDTVVDPGAVDDVAALAEIRDAVRRPKPANRR
jgi:acetoacetyl-CoA synthetase